MDQETKAALQRATHALLTSMPRPQDKPRTRHIIASDGRGRSGRRKVSAWPFASDALGVNPDQIEEARRELAEHGVNCDFDGEGRAIILSKKHFDDVSRASGLKTGRDGYAVPNGEGGFAATGRTNEREKERLNRAIERGEMDIVERALGVQFD